MDATPARDEPVSLVDQVCTQLRDQIDTGKYQPGDRLPSEAKLTEEFSVSRTVIREAIAVLRSGGVLETRKGAGVFALDASLSRDQRPFSNINPRRISEIIELLEMRSAVEIRAAGLAASRRSPAQVEAILAAHEAVGEALKRNESTRDLDFHVHFAIAEATQNDRFPQFLALIRDGIAPVSELANGSATGARNPRLQQEHGAIIEAIVDGDPAAAEAAMRDHLDNTLRRYRTILRDTLRR